MKPRPMKSICFDALREPGRIFDQNKDEEGRDDADRNVGEENPAPVVGVGDDAAEGRPQHRRDDGRDRGDAKGRAALFRRKGVEDDRLLVRLQAAAEEALQQPEDDELRQAVGDAAQKRADREHRDADQEIALAADHRAEPAGDGQHDAVGDEIGGQRPGRLVVARRQAAGDMRQRDIDDRRVEDLHEGRERHDDGDGPWVARGPPLGVRIRLRHFSLTVGTTEMPSGSGRSGSRPLSMTILTGTRCTILTKLPVAFSGGKAVNFEPEPSWMLSTWPFSLRCG